MEKVHPELEKLNTFEMVDGEKRIIASKDNYYYMIFACTACIGMGILLMFLVPYMNFMRAVLSIIIGIPGTIFFVCASIPLYRQALRGRCVMKIADGKLRNHKLSVPIDTIQSIKFAKHPNPLRLWVYDYLIVTDNRNKRHYFNLYNMSRPKTIELVFDIYVFKKPEVLAAIDNPASPINGDTVES